MKEGRMVNALAFQSDNMSSNPAKVYYSFGAVKVCEGNKNKPKRS